MTTPTLEMIIRHFLKHLNSFQFEGVFLHSDDLKPPW